MLRAAIRLIPLDPMAAHCSCNGLLCRLCCVCCCQRRRAKRETSPLLTTKVTGGEEGEMSRFRVTASPDGQSETQTVEVKVRASGEEDEDVKGVLPEVEKRRSREISPRDPATSTTFVRGSSGRSSWRMVPHSKRFSGDAAGEGMSGQSDKPVVSQETEVNEVTIELVATATDASPVPPRDYRLTQTFEDEEEKEEDEGEEEEREIVHTSSFSFQARDGKIINTH